MYQKYWDSFLLDFGVQEWDFMNKPKKNFLKKLKIVSASGTKKEEEEQVRVEVEVVFSYKNIEHTVELISPSLEESYYAYGLEEMDTLFSMKVSRDEIREIERHFVTFFQNYLENLIEYEFISKDKTKQMKDKLEKAINKWYGDGFASWEEDGKDGLFGGSFHYLGNLEPYKDGFIFIVDFGSAEESDALFDLARRLDQIGFDVETGEYSNEIIILPRLEGIAQKIDLSNYIKSIALENKLKEGDKIQLVIDGQTLSILEIKNDESETLTFNFLTNLNVL